MTPTHARRRAFTLIELLVVMALIAALSLLALMLLPSIQQTDAALKATEEVRAQSKIAQALAAGSRQPRGVRLLVSNSTAPLGNRFATELQLIEQPPVVVLDPFTLADKNGVVGSGINGPFVELIYELYNGTEPSIDPYVTAVPPLNSIKTRHCYIRGLTADQRSQVRAGGMLALPALGSWSRINSDIGAMPDTDEVILEVYPDTYLGAAAAYRTYHAGIYGPPIPLLGVPTTPLPRNTAVDLDISLPPIQVPASGVVPPYDILFAPDGQTIAVGGVNPTSAGPTPTNAGVYLWVRDVTKVVNPAATGAIPNNSMYAPHYGGRNLQWADAFRRGGEHHAVGIANGFVGVAPIQWPQPDGSYPVGTGDEFTFARKRAN